MIKSKYLLTSIVVAVVVLLNACASVNTSPQDTGKLTEQEGVIVASILVTSEPLAANDKGEGGMLNKPLATAAKYRAVFKCDKNPLVQYFDIAINKEEFVVRKLPVGKCQFLNFGVVAYSIGQGVEIPYSENFTVESMKATYIGKFELKVPARLVAGAKFDSKKSNEFEIAKTSISSMYPELAQKLTTSTSLVKP